MLPNRIRQHLEPEAATTPHAKFDVYSNALLAAVGFLAEVVATADPADRMDAAKQLIALEKARLRHKGQLAGAREKPEWKCDLEPLPDFTDYPSSRPFRASRDDEAPRRVGRTEPESDDDNRIVPPRVPHGGPPPESERWASARIDSPTPLRVVHAAGPVRPTLPASGTTRDAARSSPPESERWASARFDPPTPLQVVHAAGPVRPTLPASGGTAGVVSDPVGFIDATISVPPCPARCRMGMQRGIRFAGAEPTWPAVVAALRELGEQPVLRMIDNLPAFPDETPEDGWRELRVSVTGGMVTIRRTGTEWACVVWGNADGDLLRGWNNCCLAAVVAGNGDVTDDGGGWQAADEFRARFVTS